jgi:molybdopterin converting factor small subunit
MMVGRKCILALALASPVAVACAQQSAPQLGASRPRSAYDPAAKAGAPTDSKSPVEKALHAVNPQDKDYGAVIQTGRLAAIEETFDNFLWWADLVLVAGFSLSLAGNYWQHLRSEDRLRISSAIVAQLYNSHIASRSEALEAIDKHNRLADMYNAKCDEMSRQQAAEAAAEQKRSTKGENLAAAKVAEQQLPETASAPRARAKREIVVDQVEAESPDERDPSLSEGDEIKLLKAQLAAREQKINNLRSQVNRAHTSLEQERKRSPRAVEA